MIKYKEKGYGLHQAIVKAGHSLREENGIWISSDDVAVQAIIDSYDAVANSISIKKQEIEAFAAKLRNKAVEGSDPIERASWGTKYAQAKSYQASSDATDAPILVKEAIDGNVDLQFIVDRVIRNGEAFEVIEAKIAGTAGRHKRIIEGMTDFKKILDYDYSAWW